MSAQRRRLLPSLLASLVLLLALLTSLLPRTVAAQTVPPPPTPVMLTESRSKMLIWTSPVLPSDNNYRSYNIPPHLTNVTRIDVGYQSSFATKQGGQLFGWGKNDVGQSTVPPTVTNIVDLSANNSYALAARADGTVACWIYSRSNNADRSVCNLPAGLGNVVKVAASFQANYALKSDGTVTCWGTQTECNRIPVNMKTGMPTDLTNITSLAVQLHKRCGSQGRWQPGLSNQWL